MEKHGQGKRRTFSAEYKAEAVRHTLCDRTHEIAFLMRFTRV